jgi:hypothetical protein
MEVFDELHAPVAFLRTEISVLLGGFQSWSDNLEKRKIPFFCLEVQ